MVIAAGAADAAPAMLPPKMVWRRSNRRRLDRRTYGERVYAAQLHVAAWPLGDKIKWRARSLAARRFFSRRRAAPRRLFNSLDGVTMGGRGRDATRRDATRLKLNGR